jgi:hypothetical protein
MTSLVNPYFKHGTASEQDLFNKLKIESIQVRGRTYYYVPRHVVKRDLILGEDVMSAFPLAIPIEMYMENVMGFDGQKELYSKFGLEINSSYTLVISKDRWETEVKSQFDGDLSNGEASFDVLVNGRPQEGDLVYDPLTKFLMEIKFVDHDAEFYQLGKNYLYKLSCEAFQYSSERLETGIEELDAIETLNTLNMLDFQLLMEDGSKLLLESGGTILLNQETAPEFTSGKVSYDNTHEFEKLNNDLEWSVKNPFGGM